MNKELWEHLYEIGAIKFGEFTLKSGAKSSYYVDLRILASHPTVLVEAAKAMSEKIKTLEQKPTVLCAIPLAAVPIATVVGVQTGIPVAYTRKEPIIYKEMAQSLTDSIKNGEFQEREIAGVEKAINKIKEKGPKGHGISRYVDGELKQNASVLMVDDVISTGDSKIENAELIKLEASTKKLSINIIGLIVLIDREQGGEKMMEENGLKLYSIGTIREIAKDLNDNKILDSKTYKEIVDYTNAFNKDKK